jgi:hypothetical protein
MDVQQPWTGATSTTWDGRFAAPVTALNATVGPGASISLKTIDGRPVKALTEGTFAITVRDLSAADNFHLTGTTGIARRTGVAGRGRFVWRLELHPGIYRYRSDVHPVLDRSFTVAARIVPLTFQQQERSITTPLDGDFNAAISGTANATLELIDPATGQDLVHATPGPVSFTICSQRAVLLRLATIRPGTFHVVMDVP